jgi:inner membrane protease ATP23
LQHSRTRSPFVRFMLQKMEEAGCAVPKSFISCETCGSAEVNGGFRPDEGVVLCAEHMHSQADVDAVLTHELVHAYDQCRVKNIDWCDCNHHACSEIRAANLSGDCWMSREVARGNLTLSKGQQACVKRRAALSVAMNPNCGGPANARAAVERQFEQCFADTAPFDRVPS